jgi:rSAM/selenodomain-associated transferase 1
VTETGPSDILCVFARAPELGRVKTRLCPPLTADEALELHRALVEDTLEGLDRIRRPSISKVLLLTRPLQRSTDLAIPKGWLVGIQSQGDLGERLASLFYTSFRRGARRVVVLGSDSPTLPLQVVQDAFDALDRVDVVVGPASDGGYYLLGARIFVPDLFRGITWGTSEVLQQTRRVLQTTRTSHENLVPWYDVDRARDLERLREEIGYLQRSRPELVPRRVLESLPEAASTEYSLGPEFD